jgi:hypothetical protein
MNWRQQYLSFDLYFKMFRITSLAKRHKKKSLHISTLHQPREKLTLLVDEKNAGRGKKFMKQNFTCPNSKLLLKDGFFCPRERTLGSPQHHKIAIPQIGASSQMYLNYLLWRKSLPLLQNPHSSLYRLPPQPWILPTLRSTEDRLDQAE